MTRKNFLSNNLLRIKK